MEDEVRTSKAEFEALNEQLKSELPIFCQEAHEMLVMICQSFLRSKRNFYANVFKKYKLAMDALPLGKRMLNIEQAVECFKSENGRICNELLSSLTFDGKSFGDPASSIVKRHSSSASGSSEECGTSSDQNIVYVDLLNTAKVS